MEKRYDVAILGGGLAGLTLSLQLKQAKPDIKIIVLERRDAAADQAAHKVGESTVELGTYYLREVLNLKNYLDAKQLPKHGLRFFLSPHLRDQIHKRVELGPREFLPVPSHQVDRGSLENDMADMSKELGNEIVLGAKVTQVDIDDELHTVAYAVDGQEAQVQCRWAVDATGRASLLKRKLGFAESIEHHVSSAWFRLDYKVDVDTWSDDPNWHSKVKTGLRHLSTIHLMGKGYWVWIIPLVGDRTSVGIVADEKIHPLASYNKLDKALAWINEHEPQFGEELAKLTDKVLDFKIMKHFAHNSGETFSTDHWAVTGESGMFGDPFYSPGTDFISMSNTLVSDLILRDLADEDIFFRTKFYAQVFRSLYDNWMPLYVDQYQMWGNTQVMLTKILWDWTAYWGINCMLFINDGLTDIPLMKSMIAGPKAMLNRYAELSMQMQHLFRDWTPSENGEFSERYIDPFDLDFMRVLQEDIVDKQADMEILKSKLLANMDMLEVIAAEIFRMISNQVHGTSMDLEVDPYTMSLNKDRELESKNSKLVARDPYITKELGNMWLSPVEEIG
ncbi:MAG: flavin-dependent dehydrogenase [Gammaproteobacteria bacterium]|jgi:flavin-dependent dehydrogenase